MAAIAACLYVSLPEWQGRSRSRSLLLVPPALALICDYIMMGFVAPEHREPWLSRGALATVVVTTAMVAATPAPLVIEQAAARVPHATSPAGLGAAYLSGRAIVAYLRTRS